LERFSPEFRERHIVTKHTGDLVAVDTFFVGTLKGVGKIYLQSVIDCYSRYAFGRLYTSKLPVTAVHVLNTDVLPFFEKHDAKITTILSDNGREFCGRPDSHPYEMRSSSSSKRSNTARPKTAARNPTGSSNGCTRPCWTSTAASRAARNGMRASTKCRLTSMLTLNATTPNG